MPALYRMPAFYLAALLAATAYGVSRGTTRVEPLRAPVEAQEPAVPPTPTPPVVVADGILRDADGLRRKVVVRTLGAVCRSEPVGGRPVGSPLDYFSTHYVFAEARDGGRHALKIGPRGGPPLGWLDGADALEWDTRLMARPTPDRSRPRLRIYREEACAGAVAASGTCPRHGDRCPLEGEEAEGPVAATPLGLPILRTVTTPAGTVFEVASLVSDRAPAIPPAAPPADLRPLLNRVWVAFVVDTTASMQAAIDAARSLADALATDPSPGLAGVDLRLGLVEYRDAAPTYGFKTRLVSTFVPPAEFRAALGRISAAKIGDGSVDEAVLDGVEQALPGPPGTLHLDWPAGRAGELATKMLVLLGDAPDHAPDAARAGALAARARAAGITVAAVSVDRDDLSRGERSRYEAQWRALAEGSFRPLARAGGFREPLPPLLVSLGRAEGLSDRLKAVIDDRVEHARNLAALAAAQAEGRLQEYVDANGLSLSRVAPILVDLHRDDPRARPDPRRDGRKAPSVRRGWIASRSGGTAMVDLEVLMARDEIDALIAELDAFARASRAEPAELARVAEAAAAGESSFLAADRGEETFAAHLSRRRGLPPGRADGLLARSRAELSQADDTYRDALAARVRRAIAGLIRARDGADFTDRAGSIGGMVPVPFGLVDL